MTLRMKTGRILGHLSRRTVSVRSLSVQRQTESSTRSASHSQSTPAKEEPGLTPLDLQNRVRENIRSWTARTSHIFRGHVDSFSLRASRTFSQMGGKLNEVTGYQEIEKLKRDVVNNEARMIAARGLAKEAKEEFEQAQAQRASSRQEVNDLLQRKSSWSESDVNRFTLLVRQDHISEQEEARTKLAAARAADAVEIQFSELMRSILSRYHEEQVWSDKIRSASTYGSLAVLGLNVLVFILAIIVVEPWKRRRLVESFERRVVAMNTANQTIIEEGISDLKSLHAKNTKILYRLEDLVALRLSEDVGQSHNPTVGEDSVDVVTQSPLRRRTWVSTFDDAAKTVRDQPAILISAGAAGVAVGWLLGVIASH